MTDECDRQLKYDCESIRDDLTKLCNGWYYDRENCCTVEEIPEDNDDEERYIDLEEYLMDNLGLEITTDITGTDMYHCEICMATGGPGIYIDTGSEAVEGYWGTRRYSAPMYSDVCYKINEIVDRQRKMFR